MLHTEQCKIDAYYVMQGPNVFYKQIRSMRVTLMCWSINKKLSQV